MEANMKINIIFTAIIALNLFTSTLYSGNYSPYVERGQIIEKAVFENVQQLDDFEKIKATRVVLNHLQEVLKIQIMPEFAAKNLYNRESSCPVQQKKLFKTINVNVWSIDRDISSLLGTVLNCLDILNVSLGSVVELRKQLQRCIKSDSPKTILSNAFGETLSPFSSANNKDNEQKYYSRLRARFFSLSTLVQLSLIDLSSNENFNTALAANALIQKTISFSGLTTSNEKTNVCEEPTNK